MILTDKQVDELSKKPPLTWLAQDFPSLIASHREQSKLIDEMTDKIAELLTKIDNNKCKTDYL